jgi:hypothetical protein
MQTKKKKTPLSHLVQNLRVKVQSPRVKVQSLTLSHMHKIQAQPLFPLPASMVPQQPSHTLAPPPRSILAVSSTRPAHLESTGNALTT